MKAGLADAEIRSEEAATSSYGQDIEAPWGAPVVSGAAGKVSFVGWQNGYGQLVIVDHGGGLTTKYGHLSHIDVQLDQTVSRAIAWENRLYGAFHRSTPALRSAHQRPGCKSVAVSAVEQ